jgi:nucleotide-binding universal stress UspA family protein
VVPLDGTDFSLRALPFASWWAERFNADVVAMTTPQSLDETDRTRPPAWLDAVPTNDRVRVTKAVIDDDEPAHAVAQMVATKPSAAVCMATHARGAVGSLALGNVAEQVLRTVGVPVLLVGAHCTDDPSRDGPVVVCHDGSRAADAIVAPACAWADAAGLSTFVVHVYRPSEVSASTALQSLRATSTALGPGAPVELLHGSFPAGKIRELAHELDASLIAMSTHGRTGARRVAMGGVASWVTRESVCPVLTVRPPELDA